MARMVLEHVGSLDEFQSPEEAFSYGGIYQYARDIREQMKALAKADPPWLEEEPLTVTIETPDDPKSAYRVHAVMNTETGKRLIVPR